MQLAPVLYVQCLVYIRMYFLRLLSYYVCIIYSQAISVFIAPNFMMSSCAQDADSAGQSMATGNLHFHTVCIQLKQLYLDYLM